MKRRAFLQTSLAAAIAPWTRIVTAADVPDALRIYRRDGSSTKLSQSEVIDYANQLRGSLLTANDATYDAERAVWNGMIDRKPALIAKCEGAADVLATMRLALEHDLLISVRGGGHSISGKAVCEGGLMIDLSSMNSVRVDQGAKTVRADGGCLEGHIDRELAVFGLGTTGGIVSHTGAAGLTLGGGFGRICRQFGMACDNLVGADIVTGDGEFLHVDAANHADLLWALKGGGGNFGVVTALEYQAYPLDPEIIGGDIVFAWENARDFLRYYGEHGNALPDALNLNPIIVTGEEGKPVVSVECTWSGRHEDAEKVLQPLRSVAKPIADTVAAAPYTSFQKRVDAGNRHGLRLYMKSGFVEEFTDNLIDDVIDSYVPNPMSAVFFMQGSGATSRVSPDETAFPHRNVHCNMMRWNSWFEMESESERQERIADVRANWSELERHTSGYYVNLNEENQSRTNQNYGLNYDRLASIKARHDPTNILHMNANIQPAG